MKHYRHIKQNTWAMKVTKFQKSKLNIYNPDLGYGNKFLYKFEFNYFLYVCLIQNFWMLEEYFIFVCKNDTLKAEV